jgi:hypothetical protein
MKVLNGYTFNSFSVATIAGKPSQAFFGVFQFFLSCYRIAFSAPTGWGKTHFQFFLSCYGSPAPGAGETSRSTSGAPSSLSILSQLLRREDAPQRVREGGAFNSFSVATRPSGWRSVGRFTFNSFSVATEHEARAEPQDAAGRRLSILSQLLPVNRVWWTPHGMDSFNSFSVATLSVRLRVPHMEETFQFFLSCYEDVRLLHAAEGAARPI